MDCLLGPRKLDVVKRWPCREMAVREDLTVLGSRVILNAVTNSFWEMLGLLFGMQSTWLMIIYLNNLRTKM